MTTQSPRLPSWLRVPFEGGGTRREVRSLLRDLHLHTVCESARCPNLCECWKKRSATFLLLGDTCTRNCRFCAVRHGVPQEPDSSEPERVAEAVSRLGLRYVVLTCVTRDDLADGGAAHIARTIRLVSSVEGVLGVEVLPSDFEGRLGDVATVLDALPVVFNHNIETVRRLTPQVRSKADYERSLSVLAYAAERPAIKVKSGFMLGLGETETEILDLLQDLRRSGVSILTIGQYLPPSATHWPLARYVAPEEFSEWECRARDEFGFSSVTSGPLVRSSYMAAEASGVCPAKSQ